MRYLVGYIADDAGREALALGAMLGAADDVDLTVCTVMPQTWGGPSRTPTEPGYTQLMRRQAEEWHAAARELLSAEAEFRVHFAPSAATGLVEVAEEVGAALIVLGSARSGVVRQFAMGSVTSQLLHSSPVPLALAREGAEPGPAVRRVTCGCVSSEGSALDAAVQLCLRGGFPLRLVTFLVSDHPLGRLAGDDVAHERSLADARETLAEAVASMPIELEVETAVAEGDDVPQAFDSLDWADGDLLVIGSSTAGPVARVFVGDMSSRLLRHAPVPVLVVPREAEVRLEATAEHTLP
jgi:nucleotide-binding universal stress UspA family protein